MNNTANTNNPNSTKKNFVQMGAGVALGIALGAALQNIALGLVVGTIIGEFGIVIDRLRKFRSST